MKRISSILETEIVRLHFAEKWKPGTIASHLGLHHSVIRRALAETGVPIRKLLIRRSMADPYMPCILATLEKWPNICASRLFHMACERGYPGKESRFREVVAMVRPRPTPEAFLRLSMLPGEQGQVDWGCFGSIKVGGATRRLLAFVIVLAWSRKIFLRFFHDARMPAFLSGHVEAFRAFGGVPRELLYDNLKSAVLERVDDAIRFHPTMLDLAKHYRFGPRAAAPRRGNEKGRVERAIRYVRNSFFMGRTVTDIATLNVEAAEWCREVADQRKWPDDDNKTVAVAFEEERGRLIKLPDDDFPCEELVTVSVGKTPYARFDLNDYSVPFKHVRRKLTLIASESEVRIIDGLEVLACHERSWDRRQRVENPEHIKDLVEWKRKSRRSRNVDRLRLAVPSSTKFLEKAAERGLNLGSISSTLCKYLNEYGSRSLERALVELVDREVCHVPSVRQLLEQNRRADDELPRVPVQLPDDPRIRNIVVTPGDLSQYDEIHATEDDDVEA